MNDTRDALALYRRLEFPMETQLSWPVARGECRTTALTRQPGGWHTLAVGAAPKKNERRG